MNKQLLDIKQPTNSLMPTSISNNQIYFFKNQYSLKLTVFNSSIKIPSYHWRSNNHNNKIHNSSSYLNNSLLFPLVSNLIKQQVSVKQFSNSQTKVTNISSTFSCSSKDKKGLNQPRIFNSFTAALPQLKKTLRIFTFKLSYTKKALKL